MDGRTEKLILYLCRCDKTVTYVNLFDLSKVLEMRPVRRTMTAHRALGLADFKISHSECLISFKIYFEHD